MTRTPQQVLALAQHPHRERPGGVMEFEALRDATAYAAALYGVTSRDGHWQLGSGHDAFTGRSGAMVRELRRRGIVTPLTDLWFRVEPPANPSS